MSIMDIFRSTPKQPEAPQPQNGQQTQQPNPSMNQNSAVDVNAAAELAAAEAAKPKHEKLWEAPVKDPNAEPDFDPNNIFSLDAESMAKAVGQINFAESITSDQLAAIQEGGEGAVKAFAQAMNSVSQNVMTKSTMTAAKMIERAMSQGAGAMNRQVDKQVKHQQVSSQLQELNPALNSPLAAPIIDGIRTQLINKYPMASSTEIAKMAQEALQEFVGIAAGKKEEVPDPKQAGKVDWDKYLSEE